MCDHCFNQFDFTLPSGVRVCGQCFEEMYCRACWHHTNVVGTRTVHNGMMMCATCVNNTPVTPVLNDAIQIEDFDNIYDEPPVTNNNNEIHYNIYEIEIDLPMEIGDDPLEPPAGFDMNASSLIEHNPDYMDNMINSQIEYEGKWYFVIDGQIYSVPYEIEIDDDYVRRDIRDNWDDVEWAGSIFGEYVAWR